MFVEKPETEAPNIELKFNKKWKNKHKNVSKFSDNLATETYENI